MIYVHVLMMVLHIAFRPKKAKQRKEKLNDTNDELFGFHILCMRFLSTFRSTFFFFVFAVTSSRLPPYFA